ncbi:MAG: hypothetical protein QFB86_03905 [Patescibacteria group bacterium]|nr:hypothetical protein [Patescibacteria group bacterium]
MFGQQNNQDENHQIPEQTIAGVLGDAPATDVPADQPQNDTAPQAPVAPIAPPSPVAPTDWQHPGTPLDADKAAAVAPAVPKPSYSSDQPDEASYAANDLIDIKQKALQQLSPLVGHLEQSPEDKFRTTMMMIQASDDQTLVKQAYEAANQIEDEKARAQALLDIVNEINYFTTQHHEA